MSKSILVLDTPESCVMCPLAHYNKEQDCAKCRGTINWNTIKNWYQQCVDERDARPEWCPLTLLPPSINLKQYADNTNVNLEGMLVYQYAQGYNEFRNEILKGGK